MRKLILTIAMGLLALAAQPAYAVLIPNGDFQTGSPVPASWTTFGNGRSYAGSEYGGSGQVGLLFSTLTSAPVAGAPEDISDVRLALGSSGYAGWTSSTITGNTSPGNPAGNPPSAFAQAGGSSVQGSVFYQDITASGGETLLFGWNFVTNEKTTPGGTPSSSAVDFAFVTIQRSTDATPTVIRLADTGSALLTNPGPSNTVFSSGSSTMTGFQSFSTTLPGSGSGTYRIGFGVVNVADTIITSALAIDNIEVQDSAIPAMTTSPAALNFGNIRLGTSSASQNVTVSNTGENGSSLLGTVNAAAPSGAFPGGPLNFLLNQDGSNPSQTVAYSFVPVAHGSAAATVTVTSNDPVNSSDTINLSGVGFGPTYTSSPVAPGGTLNFGVIADPIDPPSILTLTITNPTTDPQTGGALDALTGLSILNMTITGANASDFAFQTTGNQTYTPSGVVIQPITGTTSFAVTLQFDPGLPFNGLLRNATLNVFTDQGAAFGASGQVFTYSLSGQPGSLTSAPEPSSLALWSAISLMGAAVVARKVRRRLR